MFAYCASIPESYICPYMYETINTDFSYELLEVDEDPACLDAGSWVRVRVR